MLLALPWVFCFVPVRRPKEGLLEASVRLQARVQELATTSQVLRLASQAILREPSLQQKSAQHWTNTRLDSKAALDDGNVNDMAQRLGIDIAEGGELRTQTMARIKDYFHHMNGNREKQTS